MIESAVRGVPQRVVMLLTVGISLLFGLFLYVGRGSIFLALAIGILLVAAAVRRPFVGMYLSVILMPLESIGRVIPDFSALTWAKLALVMTFLAWLLVAMIARTHVVLPRRSWLLLAVYLIALTATAAYGATTESLWGLVALLGQMALVLLVVNLVRDEREFRHLLWAIVLGSVPVVLVGVLDIVTGTSVLGTVPVQSYASSRLEVFRITATFYDPNALGRYLAFAFCVTLGIAMMPRYRAWIPVLAVLLSAQGLCLVYSFSRGGLLALAVGLVVYAVWTSSIHTSVLRLTALLGALVAVVSINVGPLVVLLERVTGGAASVALDFSRLRIWSAAIQAFAAHPLIGVGPDSVPVALGEYVGAPVSPHNLYIEIALGVGVLGFALLLAFVVPILRSAAARVRGSFALESRLAVVATIVVLATGLTLHGFRANELWLSLAMLASLESLDADATFGVES